jgi:ubiquinone/menaquinone biosynthesis C-methylase UbiE
MTYRPNLRFIDPEKVLFRAGIVKGQAVADLGAGSGFYALAAAKVVGKSGKVFVVDILDAALANVAAEARMLLLKNIHVVRADLERPRSLLRIPDGSCDSVIIGNVLHQLLDRRHTLAEAYRILKTGGKLLLVEWNDRPSPFGPLAKDRISEDEAKRLFGSVNLKFEAHVETDPYHYGLIFNK